MDKINLGIGSGLCFYHQLANVFSEQGLSLDNQLYGCLNCVSGSVKYCYVNPVSEAILERIVEVRKSDMNESRLGFFLN